MKIRDDLEGSVVVDALVLRAGDEIPDGVYIGGHLTETGEPVNVPPAGERLREGPVSLSEEEARQAAELGLPTDGIHPERVRGALIGYREGWDAAVVELAKEQADGEQIEGQGTLETFDPADHNAVEVHAYLTEHPEEIPAVLALELAREKPRTGIVDKYQA